MRRRNIKTNVINLLDDNEESDDVIEEIILSESNKSNSSNSSISEKYFLNDEKEEDFFTIINSLEKDIKTINQNFILLKQSLRNYFSVRNYKTKDIKSKQKKSKKNKESDIMLNEDENNENQNSNKNSNNNYKQHFFDYKNFSKKEEKKSIENPKKLLNLINSEKSWILKDYIPPTNNNEKNMNSIKNSYSLMEIEQRRKNVMYGNSYISNLNSLDDLYNDINDSDDNGKILKDKNNYTKKKEIIDLNDYVDENNIYIGKKKRQ